MASRASTASKASGSSGGWGAGIDDSDSDGVAPARDPDPGSNEHVTVEAPDTGPVGTTLEVPGKEHVLVREHEAHPPLHARVPTPIAEDRGRGGAGADTGTTTRGEEKGRDDAQGALHDEPESMQDSGEEENDERELRMPGSFDLSGPPQSNSGSWGDMLRSLRISR